MKPDLELPKRSALDVLEAAARRPAVRLAAKLVLPLPGAILAGVFLGVGMRLLFWVAGSQWDPSAGLGVSSFGALVALIALYVVSTEIK